MQCFGKKVFLGFYFILFLLSGCRELVTSEFPKMEPVPIINAILVAGETAHVHISQAASLDSNKIKYIKNAVVEFYEDDSFMESLEYTDSGFYKGISVIKENKTYRCDINITEIGFFTCTTTVPKAEKILSHKLAEQANKHEEGFIYPSLDVNFTTFPDKNEFFEIKIIMYKKGSELSDGYKSEPIIMEHTDPVLLNEGFQQVLFSNKIIEDSSYNMTINFFSGGLSSNMGGVLKTNLYPMVVELRTVDKSYYDYLRQFYLYETGRYPEFSFGSTTSFPLYSNINNGYGIFTSYAVHATDTIYPSDYEK